MASLKLVIFVAFLAATNVLGKENRTGEINSEKVITPTINSQNLKIMRGTSNRGILNSLRQQLQRLNQENSKICKVGEHNSFDYSKINPLHSASLPPNPTYNKIRQGVTHEEMLQILDTHNNYRAKIAQGAESRSPQQGVSQPSGSNIKELIWNDELAFIAQKWADQCNFKHELDSSRRAPCSRPYDVAGQNLYTSVRSWVYTANQWPAAIKAWYDEVADTPVSIVKKYAWGVTSKMIGHYTQLVWALTYEIGCGAVYYKRGMYEHGSTTLYVCNYGPAGNMIGDEMYKIGSPASECGKSGKSTKYPGLCATTL